MTVLFVKISKGMHIVYLNERSGDKWTWAQLFKQEKRYREFLFKNNFLSTDHECTLSLSQTEQTVTTRREQKIS